MATVKMFIYSSRLEKVHVLEIASILTSVPKFLKSNVVFPLIKLHQCNLRMSYKLPRLQLSCPRMLDLHLWLYSQSCLFTALPLAYQLSPSAGFPLATTSCLFFSISPSLAHHFIHKLSDFQSTSVA